MSLGQNTIIATSAVSLAGAGVATAEATGSLDATPRSLLVIAVSVLLSIVGLMVTALVFFLKKEYQTINNGIAGVRETQHRQTSTLAALALSHEQHVGKMNAALAERVTFESHGESIGRVHEKVNRLERALSFMRAKMGLGELPEVETEEVK